MPSRLRVEVMPALPRLGWLAVVPRAGGEVRAVCGADVEHGDGWLVEGIWDAPFEDSGFDRSQAFFGSGLRIDGGRVVASASTAPVDRLIYLELAGRRVVSNSLPLLLGATGARLEVEHDYFDEIAASQLGVHGQPRPIRIRHPERTEALQLFHGNLVLANGGAAIELRGGVARFERFEEYLERMSATILALGANLASPARRAPLATAATVSAGYDSPAVACLVRPIGVREAFTTRAEGPGSTVEDGAAVAAALGYECRLLLPPEAATSELELDFLAPTVAGSDLALLGMARALGERPRPGVVFSGHFGGVVWEGRRDGYAVRDDVRRHADDGLGLAEARLGCGFVHAPLPFLFARSAPDLRRISLSPEMAPWRLDGRYDRPIPRRILETAGVPRGLFAREKRAIWEAIWEVPYDPGLRAAFVAWLDRRLPGAERRVRLYRRLAALDREIFRRTWRLAPGHPPRLPEWLRKLPLGGHGSRQLMFKWANEVLAERRARELGGDGGAFAELRGGR